MVNNYHAKKFNRKEWSHDVWRICKKKRLTLDLSLRKFCELAEVDASNWSKIERGKMSLTYDMDKLKKIAALLKLEERSPDWIQFFDLAAVAKREIPDYVYNDEEVLKALPIFFRTASREKPSEEELNKIIALLKKR